MIECRKVGCRSSFNSYEQRKRHELVCSKEPAVSQFTKLDSGQFSCNSCRIVIKQANNLSRHKKQCKGMKPLLICSHCAKEFDFKSELERHIQQVHTKAARLVSIDDDAFADLYDPLPQVDDLPVPDMETGDVNVLIQLPDGSQVPLEDAANDWTAVSNATTAYPNFEEPNGESTPMLQQQKVLYTLMVTRVPWLKMMLLFLMLMVMVLLHHQIAMLLGLKLCLKQ